MKGVKEYIKSDLYRYYGCVSLRCFLKGYMRNKSFRFQVGIRMCQGEGLIQYFGRILYKINKNSNLQIDFHTRIGYGLYIGHNGPIIIHPTTVIGNNCNLSQFTTIGANEGNAAEIGDNVYIGPNVCVVGNVKIGNNVTIGAGSVVTKNIPENATAAGNYAKVLNYENPGRYIGNRWRNA